MEFNGRAAQECFDLRPDTASVEAVPEFVGPCALEDDDFPFEEISAVAQAESWRKEINRPIYHVHKWWAQRLGSVFRAILIGALTPAGTDVLNKFYRPIRFHGRTVFDPFMGSGTTIGEAVKLGASAIGRDINPVAHFLVRNALAIHDRAAVHETFQSIERDVADPIRNHYKTKMPDGGNADVLYYFWVKRVDCPECGRDVDLFPSMVFAKHSNPRVHPEAKAVCPTCGEVNSVLHDDNHATCARCASEFNPQSGAANGRKAVCPNCDHEFQIVKTVRDGGAPPSHHLYAKLALAPDGTKFYAAATDEDHRSYASAQKELIARDNAYPVVGIKPGYNTNQALGYNYRHWHEMFNDRQLLCLSILAERIRGIHDPALRDLFTCLFSGTLEFNNLFASYKGEGTGAVRHMFAHHILKPERTPIEANIWGTRKSSGSFITMFEGRIRRAMDYADNPFELGVLNATGKKSTRKIYGLSEPIGSSIADDFISFKNGKRVYLSCGDSSLTDIADGAVDVIVTDPPFFDNVHYSQLADFFHVWQRHILGEGGARSSDSTRSPAEVQNADVSSFTKRLGAVFGECHRVLSDRGLLAFTYHHSRSEGWISVLRAVMESEFEISAAFPVKSEMSVAMPKTQAKEPIDLDIVLVCRKLRREKGHRRDVDLWSAVHSKSANQINRLRAAGRKLSRNDSRIIIMAQLIRMLSRSRTMDSALSILHESENEIESRIEALHSPGVLDGVVS